MLLLVSFIIVTALIVVKLYCMLIWGVCTSNRQMHGKTVLITGGNSGIGFETAKNIARRGARVIITSEDELDCIRARDDIIGETGNKNIVAKYLDFTSLEVTRKFAREFLETESRLDVLINNAGNVGLGNNLSKDGLLLGLQINYFGPFLLTHLLIGLLKKTKQSRIVNVASILSQLGKFDRADINKIPGKFDDVQVYNNSKLFVVYMTWDLAAKLKGTGVTVNCLHPGAVNTAIFYKTTAWYTFLVYIFRTPYFKTPEQGAQTSIHCAVSEEVEGITGIYFQDCKPYRPYIRKDLAAIKSVIDQSIKLVKLEPKEIQV